MYGLIIFGAIVLCLLLVETDLNPKIRPVFWKCVFWMIIGGVIGARVYHVVDYADLYIKNPLLIVQVWQGGLGIFGGVVGAVFVFCAFYIRQRYSGKNFSFFAWADIFAFYAPLAHSIGRLANLFNFELLPYAVYESTASLILFCIFLFLQKSVGSKIYRGFYSGAYLVGFGIIRVTLEHTRQTHWEFSGIYVAHIFSILFIITGIVILIIAKKIYENTASPSQHNHTR
jgi:phosphatidylglycerol:prolipoprotein diacylglycerol transferase